MKQTAVEWLIERIEDADITENIWNIVKEQALKMEKQQRKQIVLNLLYHELGHDYTARWIAERLEAEEINVNDL